MFPGCFDFVVVGVEVGEFVEVWIGVGEDFESIPEGRFILLIAIVVAFADIVGREGVQIRQWDIFFVIWVMILLIYKQHNINYSKYFLSHFLLYSYKLYNLFRFLFNSSKCFFTSDISSNFISYVFIRFLFKLYSILGFFFSYSSVSYVRILLFGALKKFAFL